MTICHERRLIFIHIPKNAGTSIIGSMGVENIFIDKTIDEYKEHYVEYWDNYKKFTVIRDPIDRFISAYKFARMKESGWFSATGEEGLDKHKHYDICNSMDINGYVEYLYINRSEINRWVAPQSFQLMDKQNNIEIDYFVKFENLQEDLEKIGIKNIAKLNSSKINDNKILELTKKSKCLLYQIYDIDYSNFHYIKEFKSIFNYS